MARHRVGKGPRWDAEPFPFWRLVGRDLIGLGLLGVGALGGGLAVNALRERPLALRYRPPAARLAETVARLPEARSAASVAAVPWQAIGLEEFQAMVAADGGVVIDARPRAFYALGHVPGALSLPREDFEQSFGKLRASLEARAGQPIVVYCDEADCQDSELVARALGGLGFRQLRVFKDGWEEWLRAGLPPATPNDPR